MSLYLTRILSASFVARTKLFVGDGLFKSSLAFGLFPHRQDQLEKHITRSAVKGCGTPTCE